METTEQIQCGIENSEVKKLDVNQTETLHEDISQVDDRLYISDGATAHCKETLLNHKITHIVNVTDNLVSKYPDEFKYANYPVDDFASEDLGIYFDEATKFISDALSENEENRVLVHCFQGVSRSATIMTAFLIFKDKIPFHEAIEKIKKNRYIMPNAGFKKQLYHYQVRITGNYELPKKSNPKYYQKGLELPSENVEK